MLLVTCDNLTIPFAFSNYGLLDSHTDSTLKQGVFGLLHLHMASRLNLRCLLVHVWTKLDIALVDLWRSLDQSLNLTDRSYILTWH